MLLKPLVLNKAVQQRIPAIPRTCEACGTYVPEGDTAINVIIGIGSAGHPDIFPFQCPQEEHWACCIECWAKIAHACIDEHMTQLLHAAHQFIKNQSGGQNDGSTDTSNA